MRKYLIFRKGSLYKFEGIANGKTGGEAILNLDKKLKRSGQKLRELNYTAIPKKVFDKYMYNRSTKGIFGSKKYGYRDVTIVKYVKAK